MAGYRFNLNRWLAVEGDYDYFRNGGGAMVFDPHDTLASTGRPEAHLYTAAEVIIRCSDI